MAQEQTLILKTSFHTANSGYLYYVRYDDGTVDRFRLPGCFQSKPGYRFQDEPPEVQTHIQTVAANEFRNRMINPVQYTNRFMKYKTVSEAMEAYLAYWRTLERRDKQYENHVKSFLERFGESPLSSVTRETVSTWIREMVEDRYSFDTVRLKCVAPRSMFKWLRRQGVWKFENPFSGIVTEHKRYFRPARPKRKTINDIEIQRLFRVLADDSYRAARIYCTVAIMTGTRPVEIEDRLDTKNMDKINRTWEFVAVEKSSGIRYWRKIAIPAKLIDFIEKENINGPLPLSGMRKQFDRAREKAEIPDLLRKTFRSDFSNRMRTAGATKDQINFHQGRDRDTLEKHYLDIDAGVEDTRPFIDKMFCASFVRGFSVVDKKRKIQNVL